MSDHVEMDPQQVANGIAQWNTAATSMGSEWQSIMGQINAAHAAKPWGSDRGGQQFEQSYLPGPPKTEEGGNGIVEYTQDLGKNLKKAAEDTMTTDNVNAQEVNQSAASLGSGTGSGSGSGGGPGVGMLSRAMMTTTRTPVADGMMMGPATATFAQGQDVMAQMGPGQAMLRPGDTEAVFVSDGPGQFRPGEAIAEDVIAQMGPGEALWHPGDGESVLVSDGPGQEQWNPVGEDAIYDRLPYEPAVVLPGDPGSRIPGDGMDPVNDGSATDAGMQPSANDRPGETAAAQQTQPAQQTDPQPRAESAPQSTGGGGSGGGGPSMSSPSVSEAPGMSWEASAALEAQAADAAGADPLALAETGAGEPAPEAIPDGQPVTVEGRPVDSSANSAEYGAQADAGSAPDATLVDGADEAPARQVAGSNEGVLRSGQATVES